MWFRRRPYSDFEAEIESHVRLESERLITEGMPPAEAQAAARRAFGNITMLREKFHESHRWLWWDQLVRICGSAYGACGSRPLSQRRLR